LLLKPGATNVEAKAPSCPGFDRPGGRGGTGALRSSQVARARGAGANVAIPALARVDSGVRVRAASLACGPAGRGGHPIPRARGRGLSHPVRCGSEAREEKVRVKVSG
jgi:hypothetical protein